jgi:hypothetical protein
MTVGVIPWPQRPRLFSGRFTNGHWHGGSFASQRKDPPRACRRIQYHSAGKEQSSRFVVPNQQRAKIFTAAFWLRVAAADNELLFLGEFDFDPGIATPAALIN